MITRILGAFAIALGMASPPAPAQERDFPNRPIRMILPFTPGAAADTVARILAEQMSRKLQQPVIVDNRAGAGGAVGTEAIAAAAPDGYTIGIAAMSTHVVNPSCNPNLKYDPIRSFTPIALVADMPTILVGRPGLVADFNGFRDMARSHAHPSPTASRETARWGTSCSSTSTTNWTGIFLPCPIGAPRQPRQTWSQAGWTS